MDSPLDAGQLMLGMRPRAGQTVINFTPYFRKLHYRQAERKLHLNPIQPALAPKDVSRNTFGGFLRELKYRRAKDRYLGVWQQLQLIHSVE